MLQENKTITASPYRWRIIALLFFVTTINYVDRQVMSFVMTDDNFKRELLGVSTNTFLSTDLIARFKEEMGLVDAAFKLMYAIGFMLSGWFIDKVGTKKGYSFGIVVWSIAGIFTGFVQSFLQLKMVRGLLGFGESTNFPAAIKTTSEWFPKRERSFASGILNAGSNVGVIITAFSMPLIIKNYGWRGAFVTTAILGFIMFIVWQVVYKKPKETEAFAEDKLSVQEHISFFRLFRYKQAWTFAIGKFFADPIWYFFLTWLPTFFNDNKTLDQKLQLNNFGFAFFFIYVVSDIGSVFFGWLATKFMKNGWTENRTRKTTLLICALCVTPIYFASVTHNLYTAIGLIALATAAHQGWSANMYAIPANLFPSKYVASVTGFGGTMGTISGTILAASTGFIVAKFGYQPMFIIASCSYLVGLFFIHLVMPTLKPISLKE